MTENDKLIESVRDIPTITRMSHVSQIEKICELRDALVAAEKAQPKLEAQHLIGHVRLLIHDLAGTREDGSVLTTGYLIHRLNAALAAGGAR